MPVPPKRRTWPSVAGGTVALLVAIGVCTAALNGNKTASTSLTATPTQVAAASTPIRASMPATPKPTTPPPAPRVLLDLQGNGIKKSPEFDAPSHWWIHYTFDCSGAGGTGKFAIYVEQGGSPVDIPVNQLAATGDETTDVYSGGRVHLEMSSECTWHVTASTAWGS